MGSKGVIALGMPIDRSGRGDEEIETPARVGVPIDADEERRVPVLRPTVARWYDPTVGEYVPRLWWASARYFSRSGPEMDRTRV
jgi:hypothetical protein